MRQPLREKRADTGNSQPSVEKLGGKPVSTQSKSAIEFSSEHLPTVF